MDKLRILFNDIVLGLLVLVWVAWNIYLIFGIGGIRDIQIVSEGRFIPDLSLSYNMDRLMLLMQDFGAQGKLFYLKYQFRDFLYPFIYGSLLMGILVRLIHPKTFNIWIFIPWFAVAFDFIENYYLRVCFYDFPNLEASKVSMASWATSLKWGFIAFSFILIFIAFIRRRKKYDADRAVNK